MTQLPSQPINNFLSIEEAAEKLDVSTKTLRRWELKGILAPIRTQGGHRRYTPYQIEHFKKPKKTIDTDKVLTIEEAAKFLRVSTKTLRRWEAKNILIPERTDGGHRRYKTESLLDFKARSNKHKEDTQNQSKYIIREHTDIVIPNNTPVQIITEETKEIGFKATDMPQLYSTLHIDQKMILKTTVLVFSLVFVLFLGSRMFGTSEAKENTIALATSLPYVGKYIGEAVSKLNITTQKESIALNNGSRGRVLQAATGTPSFTVNIDSTFNKNVDIEGDLTLKGQLITTGALTVNSLVTTTTVTAGTTLNTTGGTLATTATTGNVFNTGATTLNIGGASTATSISSTTGTTTINNDLVVKGTETVSGKLTASGDLVVSGSTTLGSVTAGSGTFSSLTDSGNLSVTGTSTLTGAVTIGGALSVTGDTTLTGNLAKINGVSYTWPTSQGGAGATLTNNGSGVLSWNASGGAVTGSGANGRVAFWNGTSSLSNDASFTFNSGTGVLGASGLSLTLGSDATGDTYYRNSSGNFARLGVGTDGQVLTASSGLPVWSGGAGTGSSGFWTRTSTTLSPFNAGDNIATTGKVGIGSTSAPTSQLDINATTTTGNIFNLAYGSLTALTGDLIGGKFNLDDGNVTATNQSVTGLEVKLPTVTNTHTTGTKTLAGFFVDFGTGAGINQNGAGGTTTYNALSANLPALTQTAGTLNVNGLYLTTPTSITTGGTASGINLNATGVAAGSLYGVNIGAITGSTGTERALNIGSGWDDVLNVNGTSIINGSGITQVAGGGTGTGTYTKGDILYSDATNSLAKLGVGVGTTGYVLTVSAGGVPTWSTISGSSCATCVLTNPSSDQMISPTNDSTGLSVRQTNAVSPTHDIFSVTNNAGNVKYFYVDSSGTVNIPSIGSSASDQLTITPGTDKYALKLVGTNVPTQSLEIINPKNTSGTIFDTAYTSATSLAGTLTGINLDLATNLTVTNQSVTGEKITTPTFTNTNTTGTNAYTGLTIAPPAAGGVNQNGSGGTSTYNLIDLTQPALTQTAGTLTSAGINLTTPSSITTGGTANGININSSGVGAGTLTALNIGTITAGAGTETAISLGSGWDNLISGTTAGTNLLSFTNFSVTSAGAGTFAGNVAVNGGSITTTQTTANVFNSTATTLNIGGGATTALNLGPTGASGSIVLSGGSADTGCTLDGTTGNLTCTGNVTSVSGAVGPWSRTGTILSPLNANDVVSLTSNDATNPLLKLTSTGADANVIYATASAMTTGNILKLGQGGNTNFTGNGIYLDFDNTGQGGIGFTGNFVKFDNATNTKFTVGSGGTVSAAGVYTGTSGTNTRLQATGTTSGSTGTSSIYFLNSSGVTTGRFDTTEGASYFGDGSDGAATLGGTSSINTTSGIGATDGNSTYADGIAKHVDAATATTSGTVVKLYDAPDGIVAGDEVMLINLEGASGDSADVGNYEFLKVSAVNSPGTNEVTFTTPIKNSYDGTTPTNQKVVIQRIPQWTSVTLDSTDSLTANAWDGLVAHTITGTTGYYTGMVAFRATGTVTMSSGTSINASALGYGGGTGSSVSTNGGYPGESYIGPVTSYTDGGAGELGTSGGGAGKTHNVGDSTTTTSGGGGGGGSADSGANTGGGGGAGGGYGGGGGGGGGGAASGTSSAGGSGGGGGNTDVWGGGGGGGGLTSGGAGGAAGSNGAGTVPGGASGAFASTAQGGGASSTVTNTGGGGGGGGGLYGKNDLSQLFPGSGGGGGGMGYSSGVTPGTGGGAGGGIIFVAANTVISHGSFTSNGADGSAAAAQGGAGGGGAGGSILILADDLHVMTNGTPTDTVTANGGTGGSNGGSSRGGIGGNGGGGRIRFEAATITDVNGADATNPNASIASNFDPAKMSALGTYGTLHIGKLDTTNADLAEYYSAAANSGIEAGDVVSIAPDTVNNSRGVLYKSDAPYDSKLLGIISTNPGVTLGSIDGDSGSADQRALALSGRVPVKIASSSAAIHIGDYLTSSSEPGRAQKATSAGYTIAKALEDWQPCSSAGTEQCSDTIMAFVNPGYFMGTMTADGYVNTGQNFIANNINIKTDQNLIQRILGIKSQDQDTQSASDSTAVNDQAASDSGQLSITRALDKLVTRLETVENDVTLIKNMQLSASDSASITGTSGSSDLLTVNNLVVISGANFGKLSIGDGTIDTIGALKFQQDTIEIDTSGNIALKNGKIIGNSTFRDTVTARAGQDTITVVKSWDTSPVSITATPSFDSYVWIDSISKDGFTIKIKNPPTSDSKIYWQAIW